MESSNICIKCAKKSKYNYQMRYGVKISNARERYCLEHRATFLYRRYKEDNDIIRYLKDIAVMSENLNKRKTTFHCDHKNKYVCLLGRYRKNIKKNSKNFDNIINFLNGINRDKIKVENILITNRYSTCDIYNRLISHQLITISGVIYFKIIFIDVFHESYVSNTCIPCIIADYTTNASYIMKFNNIMNKNNKNRVKPVI